MTRKFYCLLGGAVLLGTAVIAWPQGATEHAEAAPATAGPAPAASKPPGNVVIYNPNGKAVWDDNRQVGHMTKNVTVTQEGEDFILYCDDLTFNQKTNKAIAKVNLRVESKDSTITGDFIAADFDAKLITITGTVTLHSHGANDGIKGSGTSKRRKLPTQLEGKDSTMKCDRIVYNYEDHEAVVTGNLHLIQGENTGTCDRIVFDEANNRAKLIGNVTFTNAEGRELHVPSQITIWIDDNLIDAGPGGIKIPQKPDNKAPVRPKTDWSTKPTLPDDNTNLVQEGDSIQPGATAPPANSPPPPNSPPVSSPPPAAGVVAGDKRPAPAPVEAAKPAGNTDTPKPTKTAQRDG